MNPSRTVLYIGNVGPRSHAPYTTENHIAASLTALGHTVLPVMEGPDCGNHARQVLRTEPVDLVLYTRTDGLRWDHGDAVDLWDLCRGRGIPTASVHLDLFHGIARRDVKATKDNALFAVDHVFTADGDHADAWEREGIAHRWLPPAVLYEACYVGQSRAEYQGPVAFVGSSRGYHREWPRRRELVAALERRWPDLVRAGDGRTVRDDALNDLYASAWCSAGDSLAPNREASRYWSDRIPEAAGRGSVLVHPRMDAAVDLFGDAVVWCGWDVADQVDAIEEVLSWSPDRRADHIARAVTHVQNEHTYRNRMQTVLDVVGL